MTYKDGELSIWLDGGSDSSIMTRSEVFPFHPTNAAIGASGLGDPENNFEGYVDDLRIYDDIALSDQDIAELYNSGIRPTNFLLIVGDDVNYDSYSFMEGRGVARYFNVTPTLDALADESVVFTRAHAANSVCQPSRQAMLSGKYPPSYGRVGFYPMDEGTDTVVSRLHDAGYYTAAYHKLSHMQPNTSFPWDLTEKNASIPGKTKTYIGRAPTMLGNGTLIAIQEAEKTGKPFFVLVNSADTHKPFAYSSGEDKRREKEHIEHPSSGRIGSWEVRLPGAFSDLDHLHAVRKEVSRYASSMRRLDDTVRHSLMALEESGYGANTVVMYTADNGMPMPYGKFETYKDSLRGPLIVRWPNSNEVVPRFDNEKLISLTDIAPTILDIAGLVKLEDVEGESLVPLLKDKPGVEWREYVVGTRYEEIYYGSEINGNDTLKEILRKQGWEDAPEHSNSGSMTRTMNKRGITDGTYHYIYNHFYGRVNNETEYTAFPYGNDKIFNAWENASETNATMAKQVAFYKYRAQEELYHTPSDPGSKKNLIDDTDHKDRLDWLRLRLWRWMFNTTDPQRFDYHNFLWVDN